MAIKVPGSLGGLQYVNEATYGTTPTSTAFNYAGFMESMQGSGNNGEEEQLQDGSRIFDKVIRTQKSAGYDADISLFASASGYVWTAFLALANNPSGDLGSFTTLMKLASDEYVRFRGCKIDTFQLKAGKVGGKVTASVGVKAMVQDPHGVSKAAIGSMGAENSGPANKVPITYNAYPTTSLEGSAASIPAKSFSYKISNSLKEEEGIVSGVAYAAGTALVPEKMDIELEYTLTSQNSVWDNLKLQDTSASTSTGFTVTHLIGGKTLTFTNCYVISEDHPSRSQETYVETLRIKAGALTVS